MTKKLQVTIILHQEDVDYVVAMAKDKFEGNFSQAVRKIIKEYKRNVLQYRTMDTER